MQNEKRDQKVTRIKNIAGQVLTKQKLDLERTMRKLKKKNISHYSRRAF